MLDAHGTTYLPRLKDSVLTSLKIFTIYFYPTVARTRQYMNPFIVISRRSSAPPLSDNQHGTRGSCCAPDDTEHLQRRANCHGLGQTLFKRSCWGYWVRHEQAIGGCATRRCGDWVVVGFEQYFLYLLEKYRIGYGTSVQDLNHTCFRESSLAIPITAA